MCFFLCLYLGYLDFMMHGRLEICIVVVRLEYEVFHFQLGGNVSVVLLPWWLSLLVLFFTQILIASTSMPMLLPCLMINNLSILFNHTFAYIFFEYFYMLESYLMCMKSVDSHLSRLV